MKVRKTPTQQLFFQSKQYFNSQKIQIVNSEQIPIKLWLKELEDGAMQQAKNLANFPFAFKHIAIMPDSHQGYGMPIGAILASKEVVIPNGVGVDIGCGMCALKTDLQAKKINRNQLERIIKIAKTLIPVGFNKHQQKQDPINMPQLDFKGLEVVSRKLPKIIALNWDTGNKIIKIGGGNHFIEIQKSSQGNIWLMIHSGSRNLGKSVADHYAQIALQYHKEDPAIFKMIKETELGFLYLLSKEGQQYINEMNYCIQFAYANRQLMMQNMLVAMKQVLGNFKTMDFINKPHNFASWETHFGEKVFIHRKGAMRAEDGELGMIPGSQGSKSYIIKGKGDSQSFNSCSHGAGRKLSRKKAQRELDLDKEIEILNKQGIVHGVSTIKHLDEATSAYKDIDEVMENQTDLAEILEELSPIAVLKG